MKQPTITAQELREIAAERGLEWAEMCLEEAESQVGRDACQEARAEWEALAREAGAEEAPAEEDAQ